jgi:hypothetical protein
MRSGAQRFEVAGDDRMIIRDAQRAMAKRIGATTISLRAASRAALVSRAGEVAGAIKAAASTARRRSAKSCRLRPPP